MTDLELRNELENGPLKAEFLTHPDNNDEDNQWCADKMNEVGASGETVTVDSVSSSDVLKSIVWGEVSGYSAAKVTWIISLISGSGVDPSNMNIKNLFQGVFAGATQTLQNLNDIAKRSCSRAEKLAWPATTKGGIHNARIA